MKRGLIWTGIIVVLLIAIGVVAYYGTQTFLRKNEEAVAKVNQGPAVVASASTNAADTEKSKGKGSTDSNSERNERVQQYAEWTENKIMRTLHEMTHQKVKADEKWGHVPMTLGNVKGMIAIVQSRKGKLDNYALYMNMLQKWKQGDFSQVVQEHNELWSLEDGSVGKATRRLSEKEEQAYIKRYFSDVKGTFEW